MKNYIKELFSKREARRCGVGFRSVFALFALVCALGTPYCALAAVVYYSNMGNDRILTMNNDSRTEISGGITGQGYYDTNTTSGVTFWTHDPEADNTQAATRFALHGTTHILYSPDQKPLWRLINCRAGYVQDGTAGRCTIPYSKNAQKSTPPVTRVTIDGKNINYLENAANAGVLMQNIESSCVYSPFYKDGIGTLYCDAVNSATGGVGCAIEVQIATNLTEEARTIGDVAFEDVDRLVDFKNWDAYYDWQTIPLTVLEIRGTSLSRYINDTSLAMDVMETGHAHYYRIRTKLNYYGPIRFRIRRSMVAEGVIPDGNTAGKGLISLDNIIASYPPMGARFKRDGHDYDPSLRGVAVLGNIGDFDKPFLTYKDSSANVHTHFEWVTNFQGAPLLQIQLARPELHYRWRYLSQRIDEWKTIALTTNENVTTAARVEFPKFAQNTKLVSVAGLQLGQGVGDLEYYFTAQVTAPYYAPVDYANDTGGIFGKDGSANWSEAISMISNKLDIAEGLTTPALGRDFFTRVREGESDYKWVALCTSVSTNGNAGVKKEDIRMELVGDHTWRTHYYVPTNMVGETFSFHFKGEEIFTNAWVAGYHSRTNTWYCDLAELPYIPYTSAAGLGYYHDISCTLDPAATHLMIEFNDELLSFSISHASYQNFNAWTDATLGYVGHTNWNGEGAVGVSDAKQKFVLEMSQENRWESSIFTSDFWREAFDTQDFVTYPWDKRWDEHRTPNGWTAGHGIFIRSQRGQEEMSLQMEGRGQGWLAMDSFADNMMPKGVDQVKFRARVAQEPRFDDFAWYMDGIAYTNYAISALVSMGHKGSNELRNPEDISPGNPSVSLVGYYRPAVGCYEFRVSRCGQFQLCASLFKWTPTALGMEPTLMVSNVIAITSENVYALNGSGQDKITGFNNYLVPTSTSGDAIGNGSRAYLLINKVGSTVHVVGALSTQRGMAALNTDSANMKVLVKTTDTDNKYKGKILTKGSFGVGSTDCAATFNAMTRHNILVSPTTVDTTGTPLDSTFDSGDWSYFETRWLRYETKVASSSANMHAVVPQNQTIKLEFKLPTSGDGWQPSGHELTVNSYSTNKYTFTPRVSPSYQVRLRTGGNTWDDVRTDLAVDEVEVTSWQAPDYPDLVAYFGQSASWVYTQGVVTNLAGKLTLCLQPSRGIPSKAMSLRTPFLANGMSMVSFDYRDAKTSTKLLLQVCTNLVSSSSVSESLTCYPPDNYNWVTVDTWDFSKPGMTLSSGTLTHYMSMRAPICGLMRLVVDREVLEKCIADEGKASRDVNYGQIFITGAYCYDEPALDMRSWYAWNFHTAGWNTTDKRFGYLFDSPDGLSGSLNYSALDSDNMSADAQGIGLSDRSDIAAYAANNSFVQCPPMTNGIGSVSFRARTFETNATRKSSWVTLYGSYEPDDDQAVSPESWKRICDFEITNTTYHTFSWKTTDDNSQFHAVRLEVASSRNGRSSYARAEDWEKPTTTAPLQRVFIDEISVGEPIQPRIVFRNVRPFRTGIVDIPPLVVSNVTDLSEQPLFGESWGLQCTIEPQQMGDDLDDDSIVVYAAFKRGITPWGHHNWTNQVPIVRLDRIPGTLTFRSSYNIAESIVSPVDTPTSTYPDNVWQYYVWCEFADKGGNKHKHGLDNVDWTVPSWYIGIQDLNQQFKSQGFAGYTILDTISPKRAWINEVNICDTGDFSNTDGQRQFIEIAAPRGADLTAWSLNIVGQGLSRGSIATYGYYTAQLNPNPKMGTHLGIDWTNNYTVVALRSPEAAQAGTLGSADGAWNQLDSSTVNLLGMSSRSSFNYNGVYGIELVRPSGVIEHQVVVQGRNDYIGTDWERFGSGTNLLVKLVEADGRDSQWFFAGDDATPATLGVFRSHGEDESCWTNQLVSTVSELNRFEDGTRQLIDPTWFLQPNGTNVWIYSTVLGKHIHQSIGSKTNNSEVFIIKKGTSTNIVYTADKWWALGEVTTNNLTVAEAKGRADQADNHKWTLTLKDVNETVTVYADEQAGAEVGAKGLDASDPYFPAVMDWLSNKDDSKGLFLAPFCPLSDPTKIVDYLTLKHMYWLDIDPTEEGWVFVAGMGGTGHKPVNPVQPVYVMDDFGRVYTNARVVVTMMISNTVTGVARAPDHLLGLEPGSSSLNYDIGSPAWTSATFKITGALRRTDEPNVATNYYPLRWFVFTPESFDEDFRATIDLWDQRSANSPGWFYGWGDYPGVPIWYKWRLDGDPAWYDTAEPLKADSTYSK